MSLRVEFKEFKQNKPPSAAAETSKRSRNGGRKDGPKRRAEFKQDDAETSKRFSNGARKGGQSDVWNHMSELLAIDEDRSKNRRIPTYIRKYAICYHCDRVFNAPSRQGTNNHQTHLNTCKIKGPCKCNCNGLV